MMKVYEPYANRIHNGKLENVPEKAIEAFEKVVMGARPVKRKTT